MLKMSGLYLCNDNHIKYLDELATEIRNISGLSLDRIKDLFLDGYTLQPPEQKDSMEKMNEERVTRMYGRRTVDWFWGYIEGYARASKLTFTREEDFTSYAVNLKFTDSYTNRNLSILISHQDLNEPRDFGCLAYDVIRKVSYEFCMR